MNNLQYFVPFNPQELCLEECLSANEKKIFVHYKIGCNTKSVRATAKTF